MDPNLFRLDWALLAEVLAVVTVMAFVVERSLALLFEHGLYLRYLKGRGLKEPIAFAAAFLVCRTYDIDALGILLKADAVSTLGVAITAGLVAGGSKASLKLFHDVLGVKSSMQRERDAVDLVRKQTLESQVLASTIRATALSPELEPSGSAPVSPQKETSNPARDRA